MDSSKPSDATERERLHALRRYEILDTPPDGAFDRIASLAREWFDAPIAVVSLVDESRIWFKARVGLDAREIPREAGLCASLAVGDDATLEILDASSDPRTAANSLVTGPFGLRYYAAAPIIVGAGHRLGSVAVIDKVARTEPLSERDQKVLQDLAAIVADELELRLSVREQTRGMLERAEEVRRASVTRTALGLTHDVSNRLQAAIVMLDELMGESASDRDLENLQQYLYETAKLCAPAVAAAGALGRGEPVPPLDIAVRLNRSLSMVEANAEGHERKRHIACRGRVQMLPYDLDSIVAALYGAALEYAEPGSPIEVRAEDVEDPRAGLSIAGVRLSVSHRGSAPERRELDSILDPLAVHRGALGEVSLCVALVEGLGGVSTIGDSDGEVVWSVWLPTSSKGLVVALVEDDDLIRGALARALGQEYEVLAFADAREALTIDPTSIGALVTDHNMPGMSGIELAREFRKHVPELPVMVVTGYRLDGALDPSFAFLRKPFVMADLRDWLDSVAEGRARS